MKVFNYFFRHIFIRRPIFIIGAVLLLATANYVAFTGARAYFATQDGYEQVSEFLEAGTYIANAGEGWEPSEQPPSARDVDNVYKLLDRDYKYAFISSGYRAELENSYGLEDVSVVYVNEGYANASGFNLAEGRKFEFHDKDSNVGYVPVYVGSGLSKDYPIGSKFTILDPVLQKTVKYEVAGVLEKNEAKSPFLALDSKEYYNFSLIVPADRALLQDASPGFKKNALIELIIMDSDVAKAQELKNFIDERLGLQLGFFQQSENNDLYKNDIAPAMNMMIIITAVVSVLALCLSVWSAVVSVKASLPDMTINIFCGLSYSALKYCLLACYLLVSLVPILLVFGIIVHSRHVPWRDGVNEFMTIGVVNLVRMDWLAILVVLVINIVYIIIATGIVARMIKRIPITIGILQ